MNYLIFEYFRNNGYESSISHTNSKICGNRRRLTIWKSIQYHGRTFWIIQMSCCCVGHTGTIIFHIIQISSTSIIYERYNDFLYLYQIFIAIWNERSRDEKEEKKTKSSSHWLCRLRSTSSYDQINSSLCCRACKWIKLKWFLVVYGKRLELPFQNLYIPWLSIYFTFCSHHWTLQIIVLHVK